MGTPGLQRPLKMRSIESEKGILDGLSDTTGLVVVVGETDDAEESKDKGGNTQRLLETLVRWRQRDSAYLGDVVGPDVTHTNTAVHGI